MNLDVAAPFLILAAKANTAEEIAEAIKTLPADLIDQVADHTIAICKAKGINPQAPEIADVYRQTSEYKTAQALMEKQNNLDHAFTEIETITQEYRDNQKRGAAPSQAQIDAIAERIKKQTASLGSVQEKRRIYTADAYLDECLSYDPSKDFTPGLFGSLAFPDGTTSYIGARTIRGKTTAMVNIAREALTRKQRRKTIFITLEMSGKQIMNKLILSTAFSMGIAEDGEYRWELLGMNPSRDIYAVWKRGDLPGRGANIFRHCVTSAHTAIAEAQKAGAFTLYDGRGASEAEIINFITARAEKGTVILLDYIQKMPPKQNTDTDSFRRVQAISYDVVNAGAQTNAVIIAGAQFNRMGGKDALGDVFDDNSFRECGDIEQDAHNAIGIGWKTDKQERFYEVLKTREDHQQGTLYDLDFAGGYSYMTQGDQIYRQEKTPNPKKPGKKKREMTPEEREAAFDRGEY
jgi:hypothetical protein